MKRHLHLPSNNKTFHLHSKTSKSDYSTYILCTQTSLISISILRLHKKVNQIEIIHQVINQ